MFYDLFSRLCKEKGVSVTKATVDIGLSRTIGTKWKSTGATPQGETLSKIAAYFGVSTDFLLGNEQKAPTPEGERKVNDDDIKFALFGTREIDDDILDQVKRFARFARENREDT